jgi:hypothetical protein
VDSYLQTYGVDEERRGRIIKRFVLAGVIAVIVIIAGYFFFHNRPERQRAQEFLAKVNARDYKGAYNDWGCTEKTPCPNYDIGRFMQDWAPKNVTGPWTVASTDSCDTFLTVNVQAPGSELQSLAVQRADHSIGFAPAPECQERKWHWKQFFQRITGRESPPPPQPSGH